MRVVGIIGAMDCEIESYSDALSEVKNVSVAGIRFTTGKIAGVPVVLGVSGVGKVNAAVTTAALVFNFGVTELINTGVAGGFGLKKLTTVVAEACCQYDVDTTALGDPAGFLSGGGLDRVFLKTDEEMTRNLLIAFPEAVKGIVATGDRFVAEADRLYEIHRAFGAVAVDCESCAVLQTAIRLGVPAAIVRTISDNADESGAESFEQLKLIAANNAKTAVVRYLSDGGAW